jgi:sugar-phosphatase
VTSELVQPGPGKYVLFDLEDEGVRSGIHAAFAGASELPGVLPVPRVIVDAAAGAEGKPSPVPCLLAGMTVWGSTPLPDILAFARLEGSAGVG